MLTIELELYCKDSNSYYKTHRDENDCAKFGEKMFALLWYWEQKPDGMSILVQHESWTYDEGILCHSTPNPESCQRLPWYSECHFVTD